MTKSSMKFKLKVPDTYVLLFLIILVAALGSFRQENFSGRRTPRAGLQ